MKTLIMNNAVVLEPEAWGNELETIWPRIVADRGQRFITSRGTKFEVVYEVVEGAARFGFYSDDAFFYESLVLGTNRGRQYWNDFHSACEQSISIGKATGKHLAPAVQDNEAWNCIIFYQACQRLTEEDFHELFAFECGLAEMCVRHLDHTQAAEEESQNETIL